MAPSPKSSVFLIIGLLAAALAGGTLPLGALSPVKNSPAGSGSAWRTYFGELDPASRLQLNEPLRLDLGHPMMSAVLAGVLDRTSLSPAAVHHLEPKAQAELLRAAVAGYAVALLAKTGDAETAALPELAALRAVSAVLPEKIQGQAEARYERVRQNASAQAARRAEELIQSTVKDWSSHFESSASDSPAAKSQLWEKHGRLTRPAPSQTGPKKATDIPLSAKPKDSAGGNWLDESLRKLSTRLSSPWLDRKLHQRRLKAAVKAAAPTEAQLQLLAEAFIGADEDLSRQAGDRLALLTQLPAPAALLVYEAAVRGPAPSQGRAAHILSLQDTLPEPVIERLADDLRSQDQALRRAAAQMLGAGKAPSPRQLRLLAAAIGHPDEVISWRAFQSLKERKDLPPPIIELMLQELRAGNPELARRAAEILGAQNVPDPKLKAALIRRHSEEQDSAQRAGWFALLSRWSSAEEVLAQLYPAEIVELRRLIPRLANLPAEKVASLAQRSRLSVLMASLRKARKDLRPEEYRNLVDGFLTARQVELQVVLAPSPAGFMAGDYRLPYGVPGTNAQRAAGEPLVGVFTGERSEQREVLLKRFAAFDSLIDANFRALSVLAKHSSAMTKEAGRSVLRELSIMTERLKDVDETLAGPARSRLAVLKEELEGLWAAFPDHMTLPPALADRIARLEPGKPSLSELSNLHTLINHLHQESFRALANAVKEVNAQASLKVGLRVIGITDLGETPISHPDALGHRLLSIVGAEGNNAARAIFRDDYLWYHARLGEHSVEVQAKLAPPDKGGLIRIRYSEGGSGRGNVRRLAYLASVLRELGIPAEIEGGQFLRCLWDKDHGLRSKAEIEEALPRVLRLFRETTNLDWAFEAAGEQDAAFAEGLARVAAAEGRLPFFVAAFREGDRKLFEAYQRYDEGRKTRLELRGKLNAELERLGLPLIPEGPFGQEVIDRRFSEPLHLAMARGELVFDGQGLPQRVVHRPLEELARLITGAKSGALNEEEAAFKMAGALQTVEPGQLRFESIGAVGRLRAERAQVLLGPKSAVVLNILRDPGTGAIAYAAARRWDGTALQPLSLARLKIFLKSSGILLELGAAELGAGLKAQWRRQLRAAAVPAGSKPSVQGLAASAGRGSAVTGPVTFRAGGIAAGAVFIAPFTTPDDLETMAKAAGIVTTGGGLLSHAAITTRELGLPAVILHEAQWASENGAVVLRLIHEQPAPAVQGPGGLWMAHEVEKTVLTIREGDLLRVDGQTGQVSFLPADPIRRRAHQLLAGLSKGQTPAALEQWLRGLDPSAQAAAAAFLIEEALDGSAPASQGAVLTETVAKAVSPAAWKIAQIAAEKSLETELASLEAMTEGEASLVSVQDLLSRLEQSAAKAALVGAQPAGLKALQKKASQLALERQSAKTQEIKAAFQQAAELARRADSLGFGDLPRLRRLLRLIWPRKDESILLALRRREEELTRRQRQALRQNPPVWLPLEKVGDDHVGLVGGKTAKLGEIASVARAAGGYVPPAMAVTTQAYLRFLRETGLEASVSQAAAEIDSYLAHADLHAPETLAGLKTRSERLRALILSGKLDPTSGLGREILAGLALSGLSEGILAVRSSAVQEDMEGAAFAGAAETYLYVKPQEVLEKIIENWASFSLPRGILYRRQQGILSADLRPAVLVQSMAEAESSGVLFTVNPVTSRREMVINAAFGLGEGIVSGVVEADQYTADRHGEELSYPFIGNKNVQVVRRSSGGGTQLLPVPSGQRRRRALSPAQVKSLARIGAALEDYFGFPLDVEFAIDKNLIAILQARPVTSAAARSQ